MIKVGDSFSGDVGGGSDLRGVAGMLASAAANPRCRSSVRVLFSNWKMAQNVSKIIFS